MNLQEQNLLNEQLFRLLDNDLTSPEIEQLNHRLTTDPQAQMYYCRFMEDISVLTLRGMADIEEGTTEEPEDILGEHFWRQMIEEEKNAPALEQLEREEEPLRPSPVCVSVPKPALRPQSRLSLAAAMVSAAALIFILVLVHLMPAPPPEAATLYDSLNAEWSCRLPLEPGTRIPCQAEPILLKHGIIKLLTDENVEIVLEGPTEFNFDTYSALSMRHGKLFARVSPQGLGFSVNTPHSKIIDLGTEFGVLCHPNGDAEVLVYKGKTNLVVGQKNGSKTSQILTSGSARKVYSEDSAIKEIRLDPAALVRAVCSKTNLIWKGQPLCLADLVGGGSGFGSGQLYAGIDPATGQVLTQLHDGSIHTGTDSYRSVPQNQFVDGVFVPGILPDKTVISSTGLQTDAFAKTSGTYWGYLFNGAFHQGITSPRHELRLDGVLCGTPENPALTIHSNLGITFDLDRIRASIPGLRIRAFEAAAGVSQTVSESLEREKNRSFDDFPEVKKVFDNGFSKVEFWAFVDGKLVYHQERTSVQEGCSIRIPLAQTDRFLTLAVTESDDTIAYDWALFAHPQLILESAGEL